MRISRSITRAATFAMACWIAGAGLGAAQTVSLTLFEDADRDGVLDPGERRLPDWSVGLLGNSGAVDLAAMTGPLGTAQFAPPGSHSYVVEVLGPAGFRSTLPELGADPHPIPGFPVGRRRATSSSRLAGNLRAATPGAPLEHVGIGDSIAFGFNLCDSPLGSNNYLQPYTDRLDVVGQAANLDRIAVPGYLTADLLDPGASGSIFDALGFQPDLVTISIGGNDFLSDDGNEALTAANLVAARRNLQEILSTLASEMPSGDLILNTVYDNEGGLDAFHNRWAPIWNQVLRDLATGQVEPVMIAEVWPEFEHSDPATGALLGQQNLICDFFGLDAIHPTGTGYTVHREKVWQASGGAQVGAAGDTPMVLGYHQKIETRAPTVFQDVGGAATSETLAFAQDGAGALIPSGSQELRLSGFDATPRGLLTQVVVNVRYRTTAAPADDAYRFEASVDGTFSAPGSTSTTWNTIVPIVGGAGNGVPILAFPHQPLYRTVSTTLTADAPIDGTPSVTWQDLQNLVVRVQGLPQGGGDAFSVDWDAAWVDVYGVPALTLLVRSDGTLGSPLRFDATGKQGSLDLLFAALGTSFVHSPVWGDYFLDSTDFLLFHGLVGPTGAHTLQGAVPNDPILQGITLYFQSLIIEDLPGKVGGFTNLASVTFQ